MEKKTLLIAAAVCCSLILGWHNVYAKDSEEYIKGLTRGIGGLASRPPVEEKGKKFDSHPPRMDRNQPQKSPAEVAMQLQFGLDSATLLPAAVAELENLATALEDKRLRDYKFQIEGHTCDLGSTAHNLKLSRRRAYAVFDWLTNHTSLSPEQFEVGGLGESCPLVANTDEYARRKNRRVVIRNTGEVAGIAHGSRPATLEIIRYADKDAEVVGDGDHISSGGRYSLNFVTSSKPYIYVCQFDATGATTLLFPNQKFSTQANPVQPGYRYSLPGQDKAFYLDSTTGKEQILLMALNAPLKNPESVCKKVLSQEDAVPQLVATRGIGGVILAAPHEKIEKDSKKTEMAEKKTINLCETVYGGRTRGVGGITRPAAETAETGDVSTAAEKSCEGIVLRRSFIHTP